MVRVPGVDCSGIVAATVMGVWRGGRMGKEWKRGEGGEGTREVRKGMEEEGRGGWVGGRGGLACNIGRNIISG